MSLARVLLLSYLEATEANSSYVLGNCETHFVYLDTNLGLQNVLIRA